MKNDEKFAQTVQAESKCLGLNSRTLPRFSLDCYTGTQGKFTTCYFTWNSAESVQNTRDEVKTSFFS